MNTNRIISARTQDVDPRYSRGRSLGRSRGRDGILNAEPAPEILPGQLGVLFDGDSTEPQTQEEADIEEVSKTLAALKPWELVAVQKAVERFGGRAPRNAVGISTSDAAVRSAAIRDAQIAVREVRRGVDAVAAINQANHAFWGTRLPAP